MHDGLERQIPGHASTSARLLGATDVAAACATLADAFSADPVWGRVFDDGERRREQHVAWFGIAMAQGVEYGSAWTTSGGESVALWIPAGRPELDPGRERELEMTVRETCGARAAFVFDVFGLFDENHPHDADLHYLSLLATADAHRGRGLGMGLLRATLADLDRSAARAYLESTNPANLDRYRSAGFQDHGSFTIPDIDAVVTTMIRDPRPVTPGR